MIIDDLKKKQGNRLSECIYKKYESQAEFSRVVQEKGNYNLTAPNLNAMIKGKRSISIGFVRCAAPLLGVSEEFLLCETDFPQPHPRFEILQDIATTYNNSNAPLLSSIIVLLELYCQTDIFFYVLKSAITPETMLLNDFIKMHREDLPQLERVNKEGKRIEKMGVMQRKAILTKLCFDETMPASKEELKKCSMLFEDSTEEERNNLKYHNWESIRTKCTFDNLSAVTLSTPECFYHGENGKCEVIIECVEMNNKIIPYGDFISLALMGAYSFAQSFECAEEMSHGQSFKKDIVNMVNRL